MANFAELRLFGRALRNTNDSNTVDSVLIRNCASKGYVMHPECDPERVKSFMQSLPNNINTTFYASFNDVLSKNPYDLWMDQCMHYASTYGTGHHRRHLMFLMIILLKLILLIVRLLSLLHWLNLQE